MVCDAVLVGSVIVIVADVVAVGSVNVFDAVPVGSVKDCVSVGSVNDTEIDAVLV